MTLLFPLLLLVLMYMLLIRPQQQRARRARAVVSSLDVGDRVVSIGGIVGEIVSMDDEMIDVEVADGVVLTFLRGAINRKLDPPAEADGDGDEVDGTYDDGTYDEDDDTEDDDGADATAADAGPLVIDPKRTGNGTEVDG